MSGHAPIVLSGGRAWWVTCSCGWTSEHTYGGRDGAQAEWCEHIAPRARRKRTKKGTER